MTIPCLCKVDCGAQNSNSCPCEVYCSSLPSCLHTCWLPIMATLHSSATKIHLASKAGRTMYAQLQAATAAATAATELHLSLSSLRTRYRGENYIYGQEEYDRAHACKLSLSAIGTRAIYILKLQQQQQQQISIPLSLLPLFARTVQRQQPRRSCSHRYTPRACRCTLTSSAQDIKWRRLATAGKTIS